MRRTSTINPQNLYRELDEILEAIQSVDERVGEIGSAEEANRDLLDEVLQSLDQITDAVEELQNAVGIIRRGEGDQKRTSSELLLLTQKINEKVTSPPTWKTVCLGAFGSVIGAIIVALLLAILLKLGILGPFFQR